ncbi:hypothetical protein HanIR_Chr14g0691891 [Helianthus annuus]|nr:hypothetical protein HanIR_Chr14g0691891 [Helianthus annuus]
MSLGYDEFIKKWVRMDVGQDEFFVNMDFGMKKINNKNQKNQKSKIKNQKSKIKKN